MKEESLKRALESLKTESAAISQIAGYLDMQAFSRAVEVLSTCPKIITCASGTLVLRQEICTFVVLY